MSRALPAGTVTFLFTDVEGSTKLLDQVGEERYEGLLADHRAALRKAFIRHGGVEIDTQGDAFFYVFTDARAALASAVEGQAALAGGPIAVRMGLHSGEARRTAEGYVGREVHRAARIAAAGHGGQIVLSKSTAELTGGDLLDLGEHRLKDFAQPVPIFQVGSDLFPPLSTISNTNLPSPTSRFVGRDRELSEITALLRDGARLLTLTGPGGSGKTRLAVEAASDLVPQFKAGVFWVGLAPLRDASLVPAAIAETLGAKDGLADHIGERELMLLLDNLEQIIDAAPGLASLVERCPNLRLLVTSRELLRVRGEVEYAVPPLSLPEATELFCERSKVPWDEAVDELCRRLDNLPLAVELAAAWANVLAPSQILERLTKRLDLLRGGRDAEARQRTLRATIEWSYDLLRPEEKTLFERLAVFRGGWTFEAAEQVCDADLDVLRSLVDKSLARRWGSDRLGLLETIRAFAAEMLGDGHFSLARRLTEYLTVLAERANLRVEASGEQRHDLVAPERHNIEGAVTWALEAGDLDAGIRLLWMLENYLVTNAPSELAHWLDEFLAHASELDPLLRARAYRMRGAVEADAARRREWYERSLDLFRSLGDTAGVGHILLRVGMEAAGGGELEQAEAIADESEELGWERRPRDRAIAAALRARIAEQRGDDERALALMRESADLAGECGFTWWRATQLAHVADHSSRRGRPDEAGAALEESLRLFRLIGDRDFSLWTLAVAARLAAQQGRPARAGVIWGGFEAEANRAPGDWEELRRECLEELECVADEQFESGRRRGRALSFDGAIDYALSGLD
jgi:predicted ATPase